MRFKRLNSYDIRSLWTAIEEEIKGGEVGDKVSPELWVDRGGRSEKVKGDSGSLKEVPVEDLPGAPLGQETVGPGSSADLDETLVPLFLDAEIGEQNDLCVNSQITKHIPDHRQVQVRKSFKVLQEQVSD